MDSGAGAKQHHNHSSQSAGWTISSNLFGIFFEEISMAGDGGIYAELIRNRNFEDAATPDQWTLVTNGTARGSWSIDTSLPLSSSNTQSLKLTMTGGSGSLGAVNNGYYGIPLVSGRTYNLGFYARAASGFSGNLAVALESTNGGTVYAQNIFSGLTTSWQHFTLAMVPNATIRTRGSRCAFPKPARSSSILFRYSPRRRSTIGPTACVPIWRTCW